MTTMIEGFRRIDLHKAINPERFHLILFPTEQCNFRCVYCYEDFAIGAMQPWLVEAIKQFLTVKIPQLKVLELSWFGGEPLAARQIVVELATFAKQLADRHGVRLTGDVTTNGSLLDVKTLRRLVELGQRSYQISIDGDEAQHDLTRLTRSGKGSFSRIWQRLLDAQATDLDFHIILRVHVTALNQASVQQFCQRYQQTFAADPRFSLFFKAIENLGGDNQQQLDSLTATGQPPRQAASEFQQRYAPKHKEGHYICYAAKPNSLAIRANGNLNKCTVALQEDYNNIGRILPDGSLQVENQKYATWLEGFEGLNTWRLGCPHSYFQNQQHQARKALEIPIHQVA